MTETVTNRFGVPRYGDNTDAFAGLRQDLTDLVDHIEDNGAMFGAGALADRPAANAAHAGRAWINAWRHVEWCNGAEWLPDAAFVDLRSYLDPESYDGAGSPTSNASTNLTKWQAALNDCRTLGLPLHVPAGDWWVVGYLDITGVRVLGDGEQVSRIIIPSSTTAEWVMRSAQLDARPVAVEGIGIIIKAGATVAAGILLNNQRGGADIRRVRIVGATTTGHIQLNPVSGGTVTADYASSDGPWTIERCELRQSGAGAGIVTAFATLIRIAGCAFIGGTFGVHAEATSNPVARTSIENCTFSGATTFAVSWEALGPLDMVGCVSSCDRLMYVGGGIQAFVSIRETVSSGAMAAAVSGSTGHIAWHGGTPGQLTLQSTRFVPVAGRLQQQVDLAATTGSTTAKIAFVTATSGGMASPSITTPTDMGGVTVQPLLTGVSANVTKLHFGWARLNSSGLPVEILGLVS